MPCQPDLLQYCAKGRGMTALFSLHAPVMPGALSIFQKTGFRDER